MTNNPRRPSPAPDTDPYAALDRFGWLSRQSPDVRALVKQEGHVIGLRPRQTLANEGDADARMFGILEGYVGCLISHRQNRPVLGTIIGAGAWFGQGPLIDGEQRQLTFTAMEQVRLLVLDAAAFVRLRAVVPDIDQRLAQLPMLQVRYISQMTSELLLDDVSLRVAAVLLRLCEGRTDCVRLPLLQSQLGEMSNASRNSVSKALKVLEGQNLVRLGYGELEVLDPVALANWYDVVVLSGWP